MGGRVGFRRLKDFFATLEKAVRFSATEGVRLGRPADSTLSSAMKHVLVLALTVWATFSPAAVLPESTKIDELLSRYWEKQGAKPNAPASEETLVRRLYLDIAGRVPTVEEAEAFLNSRDPLKRTKLIDQLLAGDGFTSHMFNYWADVLRLTDNVKGRVTAQAYEEWLKGKVKANTPFDQMVRELLTTEGGVWDSGAIGFYMRDENQLDHLAYTVQVFLGTQIVCAQCHNHPFDKWTQRDYYQMAAYTYGMDTKAYNFAAVGKRSDIKDSLPRPDLTGKSDAEKARLMKQYKRKVAEARQAAMKETSISRDDAKQVREAMQDIMKPLRYTNVSYNEGRMPKLPHDYAYNDAKPGEVLPARTMFGHDAIPVGSETRLEAFARWMTSPENPRFTTVVANRMWKRAFGMGLIEPVDEMMDSTVASIPELMDYLTQLMIEKRYSLKSFLRVLYNTEAYQREASRSEVLPGETYHFTGPLLRRMSAEQIWDTMATLISGNTDSTVDEENVRLARYLDDLKFLMNTMKDKGVEGLVEIAKKANATNEANLAALEAKRKALAESGDEKDAEAAKDLAREAAALRRERQRDILVEIMGEERAADLRQGYNDKPGKKGMAAMLTEEMKEKLMEMSRQERRQAMQKMNAARELNGLNPRIRASEQPSPAKPGTFLRTFGQSDREEIENGNRDASVPQALALLNGPAVEILTSPGSLLQEQVAEASGPAAQVEKVYRAFFSRAPTKAEKDILSEVIRERGDRAVEDVIHALLTSSQFLFIQ